MVLFAFRHFILKFLRPLRWRVYRSRYCLSLIIISFQYLILDASFTEKCFILLKLKVDRKSL